MMKNTLIEKELAVLRKRRGSYLERYAVKKELSPELMAKIPQNLRSTLISVFCKAFEIIFKNGTPVIDKTYNKSDAEQQYKIDRYAYEVRQNRRSLNAFAKRSDASSSVNLLISGLEGIGLGLVGCGLPDIPLFTAVLLRSLNETSMHYGYDYTKPEEQMYQLLIIQGAMSYGKELRGCLELLDGYTEATVIPDGELLRGQIEATASAIAEEMLLLKFVQGIPIVGVIGGISDSVFLHRIQRFAKLNYQYRLLHELGK